ncbi:MAG: hypothetical protein WKG32_06495 [Gemmatimonadaceae bacterium]
MNQPAPAPSIARRIEPIAVPLGLGMLVVWAVGTFAFPGPGWLHFFLSLGVFFVIWGIVARVAPAAPRRER